MQVEAWAKTDVGLRRESNQDSILVEKDIGLFIVADGMGGHKGGEVASAIAVEVIYEMVLEETKKKKPVSPYFFLSKAYQEASMRIHNTSAFEKPELKGMGTTLVTGLIWGRSVYIANVGDSRTYLFRNPYLWQLTEDHSLVYEQQKAGFIQQDSENIMGKNVITRSVGFEKDILVDILERKTQAGESFLMCSDGLTGMVSDSGIAKILQENASQEAVSLCVDEAKKNGGDDNISVIIFSLK